ncbi:hypothetical protein V3C99_010360 [Haemonchus contortus]|uniref:Protein SPT2 homolog n=1 Tax=Haemonchus contortus TaxID=6289 RepID=A0A7I4YH54_HAECO|nr:Chromatin SPT2 domain containing protein [Haemonchus contortus]
MDFMQLLDTANKNAKSLSKKIDVLKSEVDSEKRAELKRIEAEKKLRTESLKRKKEATTSAEVEKKFVIPKKKKESSDEDKAKVLAYLAKKAEEERQALKKKQAEKERLIQLRLQAHGGKASKKIAKNFGLTALDMQIRYGHDHEHVERLQKQAWREEEERDKLAAHYRDGVYKAIAHKREIEEKVKRSGPQSKQPHRAGGSKSDSIAGPSNRHQNNSGRPTSHHDVSSQPKMRESGAEMKKNKSAPVLNFDALMKTAKDIAEGKECNLSSQYDRSKERTSSRNAPAPSRIPKTSDGGKSINRSGDPPQLAGHTKQTGSFETNPRGGSFNRGTSHDPHVRSERTTSSSKDNRNSNLQKSAPEEKDDMKNSRKDHKGRFKKGPTPPPLIPPAVEGKRYLPGDIRYKKAADTLKPAQSSNPPGQPGPSKVVSKSEANSKYMEERHKPAIKKPEFDRNRHSEKGKSQKDSSRVQDYMPRKRDDVRLHDRKRDSRDHYDRARDREKYHRYDRAYDYDDVVSDEDDYDSEMDDFIDDSGLDMDELSRQEFEETLKMVNPKYNKKKWREREQTISLRDMHADYRTIAREEARSARIGLIEDLHEATKGKSEAL